MNARNNHAFFGFSNLTNGLVWHTTVVTTLVTSTKLSYFELRLVTTFGEYTIPVVYRPSHPGYLSMGRCNVH